jgi:hypothetical protein
MWSVAAGTGIESIYLRALWSDKGITMTSDHYEVYDAYEFAVAWIGAH